MSDLCYLTKEIELVKTHKSVDGVDCIKFVISNFLGSTCGVGVSFFHFYGLFFLFLFELSDLCDLTKEIDLYRAYFFHRKEVIFLSANQKLILDHE